MIGLWSALDRYERELETSKVQGLEEVWGDHSVDTEQCSYKNASDPRDTLTYLLCHLKSCNLI